MITTPPRDSIRRRLQRLIVLTTAAVLAVSYAIFIYFEWRSSVRTERMAALSTARITADASSAMLAFDSKAEAEKLLGAFRVEPDVLAAALYDKSGKIFAQYITPSADCPNPAALLSDGLHIENQRLLVFQPVMQGGRRFGTFYLQTDLRDTYVRMSQYGWAALVIFIAALAAAYLIGHALQKDISAPILSLAETANVISRDRNYTVRAEKVRGGELEVLTGAFNQMLDEIQRQQEALAQEKQLLATTLASIGDAVIVTNAQTRITFLNPEAERLTGWENAEATGKPLPDVFRIINEYSRQPVENPADKVLRLGKVVGLANHTLLLSKTGNETPIDDSAAPIRQADGTLHGVVLVFRDFTVRRQAEVELRKNEQEIRKLNSELRQRVDEMTLLLNILPVGVLVGNKDCSEIKGNAAAYQILGFTQGINASITAPKPELPGGLRLRVNGVEVPPEDLPMQKVARTGQPWNNFEHDITFPDGTTKVVYGSVAPLFDEHGEVRQVIAAYADFTERKKIEDALREAHEQLANRAVHLEKLVEQRTAKLNEVIGDLEAFSYSIVHDMRSPLRAMQSFAYMLGTEFGPISPNAADYLQRIKTAAERLDQLIQDGLSYSRILRDELPLTPIDVTVLIRGMMDTYPTFQSPNAIIELAENIPLVNGNEAALTQCISNLLGNAIKFVAPGVTPHIKVWGETHGAQVRVNFKDNGIGIDPGAHEKIFQLFQRLDYKYEGTGIGLAIVKKAAERMGGTVGVESAPGAGSTFWLELKSA